MMRWAVIVLGMLVASCASTPKKPPPPVGTFGGASWGGATPASASSKSGGSAPRAVTGAPQTFAFGWRVPCRVPVAHYVEKKGKTARLSYAIAVRSRPDGRLGVQLEDMKFVEADGVDVTTPEWQARLAPAIALTATMPTLVVTPEGEYVGTEGLDAMVENMLSSKLFREHANTKALRAVAKTLRSPRVQAMLSAKMGDYWRTWVDAWVGLELAPGGVLEGEDAIDLGKKKIPTRVRFEHHGPAEAGGKLVRVSLVSTMDGDKGAAGVELMLGMLQEAGIDVTKEIEIESFRREVRVEAETDPASLRPSRTRFEVETEMSVDGKVMRQREVREDRFDWEGAEGCL